MGREIEVGFNAEASLAQLLHSISYMTAKLMDEAPTRHVDIE